MMKLQSRCKGLTQETKKKSEMMSDRKEGEGEGGEEGR